MRCANQLHQYARVHVFGMHVCVCVCVIIHNITATWTNNLTCFKPLIYVVSYVMSLAAAAAAASSAAIVIRVEESRRRHHHIWPEAELHKRSRNIRYTVIHNYIQLRTCLWRKRYVSWFHVVFDESPNYNSNVSLCSNTFRSAKKGNKPQSANIPLFWNGAVLKV